MEITQKHVNQPSLLNEELSKIASQRQGAAQTVVQKMFEQAVLSHFPVSDWCHRPLQDLSCALTDFFAFVSKRKAGESQVKVYNPSLDEDGWISGRTVVLLCCEDKPFLVDSVRMVFESMDYAIHISKSTVVRIEREAGRAINIENSIIDKVAAVDGNNDEETFAYFEVTAILAESERQALAEKVTHAIQHVQGVVADYKAMQTELDAAIGGIALVENNDEAVTFLQWLKGSHFTFLGYRELDFDAPLASSADLASANLREDPSKRLGIFTTIDCDKLCLPGKAFVAGARDFHQSNDLLCFSKSSTRSTVHRNVYPDYIVVKKVDADGRVTGERRFLGFYTYAVSSMSPSQIPVLREKVQYIIEQSGLNPRSHDGKRLIRAIDLYPKEELFQGSADELFRIFSKIVELNERDIVRLIVRPDVFEQFVSCMVFVPKDLYNTGLRLKIQKLLGDAWGTHDTDITTFFSESKHARAHIVFTLPPQGCTDFNVDALEADVIELAYGWKEHFHRALDEKFGEGLGGSYYKNYCDGIPQSYQESFDARVAAKDVEVLNALVDEHSIVMQLYQPVAAAADELKFRVAHLNTMLELSDVIPILENLGLRVLGEQPFKIRHADGRRFWLHDFQLKVRTLVDTDVKKIKNTFEAAFEKAWKRQTESDAFNQLVTVVGLDWREVNLLRAYANYMKQTLFHLSLDYIADTLVSFPATTQKLIALFDDLFNPEHDEDVEQRRNKARCIAEAIELDLEAVQILNQDKVYRRYLDLFFGSLRTNYFQCRHDSDGAVQFPDYLSLKFSPSHIPDIPEPKPSFEFFVYSARVEGVHLRTSKVARGGLRWSDRQEDYRTEVLGLVKAQQVKNAVIVPSGAKGGFVAKQLPVGGDRAAFFKEGVACYKIFIRGLLDLTDNLIEGRVIKPKDVVCLDDDDPYLVVAADKGTATFSDIANEISVEKGHWLGDAFASGGSQGYDHKGMGITAKGAWVSVQRHFREKNLNTQTETFRVIGIGDMAGDVFGNGMLLSETIQLVAAFNHLHIFIDPEPDHAASFVERQRLFTTPGTSWADYDKKRISKGGGVFKRSDKYVQLSPEIMALVGTAQSKLTPLALITLLLKAEVDLIWNGGIGTYVKALEETHAEVGDKANDALRINGRDLRCRVFGEGGNLGMTQRGRVEFTMNGGACYTDFIDNAAGVDCSDHEVNIKILIDEQVAQGDLTGKQRNALLVKMTESVSDLVLDNNYRQTLALSISQHQVLSRMNEYRRFIDYLEGLGQLDRQLEFLPSDSQLVERSSKGQTLTHPELAVLISYAKVQLKEALAHSDIADDEYCGRSLFSVFPKLLHKDYQASIKQHKLRKQIVATQLANNFVNNLGITAYHRLWEATGSTTEEVVKAYVVARDIFEFEPFIAYVSSLDYALPANEQYELVSTMMRRVRRGTRWFLKNRRSGLDVKHEVKVFTKALQNVQKATGELMPEQEKVLRDKKIHQLKEQGIAEHWLDNITMPENLFSGLGVAEIANCCSASIEDCSQMFLTLMHELKLNWFANQLSEMSVENYWQANAREAYIDDLESQLRKLSTVLLSQPDAGSVEHILEEWLSDNESMVMRWNAMVGKVESATRTDYAMFAVALRELNDLVQVTVHNTHVNK